MRPIDADLLEKQLLELAGDNPPMFHYFSEAIGVIWKQPTISALENPTVELAFNDDKKYVMINGELYRKAKFDFPEGTQTVSVKRPEEGE